MIGKITAWLGAQRWLRALYEVVQFVTTILIALVLMHLGGLIVQWGLQHLGIIPHDWPVHFTAMPLVLATSIPLFLLMKRLSLVKWLSPRDPEWAAAALAFLPFSVPLFLCYLFLALSMLIGGAMELFSGLSTFVPGRWIVFILAAACAVSISFLSWQAAGRIDSAKSSHIVTGFWGAIAAAFMAAWWTNWLGPTNSDGGSLMMAGALISSAMSIVGWLFPVLRAISGGKTWLTILLAIGLAACAMPFVFMTAEIIRFGLRAPPIVNGRMLEWAAWGFGPLLVLELLKRWRGVATPGRGPLCVAVDGIRDGLPSLSWTQEVGTGDTIGSRQDRFEIIAFSIAYPLVLYFGYRSGGLEGLFAAFILGGIFCGMIFRNAPVPDLNLPIMGNAGRGGPRGATTPAAQKAEAQLVTRREDCTAFLARDNDTYYFCVARGAAGSGKYTFVDRVPWDSFGNFEEASHKQWFRSQGGPDDVHDWSVIIAESNVPKVICVAASVRSRSGLIELLSKLQATFIVPRQAMLKALQAEVDARQSAMRDLGGAPLSASDRQLQTPVTPF